MTDHNKQTFSSAQSQIKTQSEDSPSNTPLFKLSPTFHDQLEVRKNQIAVHLLYVQIMKEFTRRLVQQHRSSSSLSIFASQDHIEKLYSGIKYYYNQSVSTYNHCVKQRESGDRKRCGFQFLDETQNASQKNQEKDCSFLSEQSQMTIPFEMPDLFKREHLPKPVYNYRATNKIEFSPKEQPEFITKKDQEETSSNSDTESQDQLKDYASKAELHTNSLIIGDFMANRIKRKPKQEKILLELHNVFLKLAHNGRDTFYDRASLQLINIEKTKVPI